MSSLKFLKILLSPFKPFNVKVYCGKTAIGVPYFYPRKWVKGTPKLAHKATLQYIQKEESYNKRNPNSGRTIRPYEEVYREKLTYSYAVPLKIGFSFCGLGYKTKWTDTDYRYEYGPVFSFVTDKSIKGQLVESAIKDNFFGWQYGIGLDFLFLTLDARMETYSENIYKTPEFDSKNGTFVISLGLKMF